MVRYTIVLVFIFFTCMCFGQTEWVLEKNEQEIKVWTKTTDNSMFKSFKAETVYNYSAETVIAALLDIPSIPDYYDMIIDVKDLIEHNNNSASYTLQFDFPWPVKDRYAEVTSVVTQNQDKQIIVKTSLSKKDNPIEDHVRVDKLESYWYISALSPSQTKIVHQGHMEPGGSVPGWLASSQVSKSPFLSVLQFKSLLPKYTSKKVDWLNF